jgi:hypothetical protein
LKKLKSISFFPLPPLSLSPPLPFAPALVGARGLRGDEHGERRGNAEERHGGAFFARGGKGRVASEKK